jgi:hypothetical protein
LQAVRSAATFCCTVAVSEQNVCEENQSHDFGLPGASPSHLDESDAFRLHGPDRLCSAMEERLGHCGLVRALDATYPQSDEPPLHCRPFARTIQPVVSRLERHLDKRVGAEPMPLDEVAPISLELQRLRVVLADQVGDPRLGVTHAGAEVRRQSPLELLRRSLDLLFDLVRAGLGLGSVGPGRQLGFENGRGRGVDRLYTRSAWLGTVVSSKVEAGALAFAKSKTSSV